MTPTDESVGRKSTRGDPSEGAVRTLFQAAEAEALNWRIATSSKKNGLLEAACSAVTALFRKSKRLIE